MIRRSPISTLFPYTTLFRSLYSIIDQLVYFYRSSAKTGIGWVSAHANAHEPERVGRRLPRATRSGSRSEEHTSELQSHSDLVCRLLLEKKKKITEVSR